MQRCDSRSVVSGKAVPVLGLIIGLLVVPQATARTIDGRIDDWVGLGTDLGGTSQYSAGELVHQDYIYDDHGPHTGQRSTQLSTTSLDHSIGDYRYPTDESRFGNNCADIDQVRFAADTSTVYVLVRLNSLLEPDTTVVAIGLDLDRDVATGGGPWPHEAGFGAAGTDTVLTVRATAADLTDLATGSTFDLVGDLGGGFAVDAGDNAIEVAIPRAAAPGTVWDVRVVSGLWDADGGVWMSPRTQGPDETTPGYGSPFVTARGFNVAFRPQEQEGNAVSTLAADGSGGWFERHQAEALATGDITPFVETVDLGKLVSGADEPYVVGPGFHQLIVDEGVAVCPNGPDGEYVHICPGSELEGMSYDGTPGRGDGLTGNGRGTLATLYNFYNRRQPSGLYLPSTVGGAEALPLLLYLHGYGGGMRGTGAIPGFVRDMGEAPPRIVVEPLARGKSLYVDYGERSAMKALEATLARFASSIDTDRVYIGGYSMGGYGAMRLGSLYPDRFAAAISWAGFSGQYSGHTLVSSAARQAGVPLDDDYLARLDPRRFQEDPPKKELGSYETGDINDVVANFLHLPLLQLGGAIDELMPITSQLAPSVHLDELGYRHRFHLYPTYEHLSFALVDTWATASAWLEEHSLKRDPRRVVLRYSEGWGNTDLDLVHGNAYWVRDLRQRDNPDLSVWRYGQIDATSEARPGVDHTTRRLADVGADPFPYVVTGMEWDPGSPLPLNDHLGIVLEALGGATIDMQGAGLATTRPVTVEIGTDGPALLRLAGGGAGAQVNASAGVGIALDGDDVVLSLPGEGSFAATIE